MKLKNKRILVTRPNEQADYLSDLITNHGGFSVRFPTVEIQSLDKIDELSKCFNEIGIYDFIIFLSRNAAKITLKFLISNFDSIKAQLVTIGPSTADELSSVNFTDIIYPKINSDSEALLNLKEMQTKNIRNKKVLIIRGVGGRELLVDKLKKRGAIVSCVEVYKRIMPKYDESEIKKAWHDKNPDAIVATSNEVIKNLIVLLKNDKKTLFSIPLVAMSERVATYARDKGFTSRISIVSKKSDDGILASLLKIFGD